MADYNNSNMMDWASLLGPIKRANPELQEEQGTFGMPLQDAGWRRWFDALKEAGVDQIAPSYGFQMGMSRPEYEPVFADPDDPNSKLLGRQMIPGYSTREYEVTSSDAPSRGLRAAFKKGY